MGPLLFALALRRVLCGISEELKLDFIFSCVDDAAFAGDRMVVAAAIERFRDKTRAIGLEFHESKCEINPSACPESVVARVLFPPVMEFVRSACLKCLGTPVGHDFFPFGDFLQACTKGHAVA